MLTAAICIVIILGSGELLPPIIRLLAGLYGVLSFFGYTLPLEYVLGGVGRRQGNDYYGEGDPGDSVDRGWDGE